MTPQLIRIGTRGSALALKQAETVAASLQETCSEIETEIVPIITTGDKILDKNLYEIGGKGLFTKEIEEKLFDHSIDIAVHSMKDIPATYPKGLHFPCFLEREDPRDAFISYHYSCLEELPAKAKLGTSSPRRAAQAKAIRPDIEIIPFRGNVGTRLAKLIAGEADATLLAMAGLNRLGIAGENAEPIIYPIDMDDMIPAVAQGAIGIECREDDSTILQQLQKIHHQPTAEAIHIERTFLIALEGSCRTPLGAHAIIKGNHVSISCFLESEDGILNYEEIECDIEEAEAKVHEAALEMRS